MTGPVVTNPVSYVQATGICIQVNSLLCVLKYGKYTMEKCRQETNIAQSKAKCYISSQDHYLNAIFPYSTSLGNALTLIENLLGCIPQHYRTV